MAVDSDVGYSTSFSVGSSAEIRSDLRKRRSFALISSGDRLVLREPRGSWRRRLPPVDEPNHGFERHAQFEPGRASFLTARLDPRVVSDRGGNGVGQFPSELVHERIHADLHAAPSRVKDAETNAVSDASGEVSEPGCWGRTEA